MNTLRDYNYSISNKMTRIVKINGVSLMRVEDLKYNRKNFSIEIPISFTYDLPSTYNWITDNLDKCVVKSVELY